MSNAAEVRKLYLPGLAGLWDSLSPYGYVIIRFAAGAILIYHGWAKLFLGAGPFVAEKILAVMGFSAPFAWMYFLALLETVGGAMLALGLFVRPIAFMLAIEMAVITFGWLFKHGFFFNAPGGGYEYTLLLMFVYIGILFRGGDRCAIDRMIGKEF